MDGVTVFVLVSFCCFGFSSSDVLPGGVVEIPLKDIFNHPELLKGIEQAISEASQEKNANYKFLMATKATSQVVAGVMYRVSVLIAPSSAVSQSTSLLDLAAKYNEFLACYFEILSQPWMVLPLKVSVKYCKPAKES
uniref:Toxin candidate TRINITY_DN88658_c0_g1_i1 n=1 Tax=Pachycerianthus maua TaxID=2736681 RepID=A0A7G7WYZ4_9CNID|nr:toxin candidate TRINITY_DN88658_c0_g1_i1 [Pachycerianthus maua]